MIDLNPLNNPDALWQHLLMIFGAAVIGYIIGYISAENKRRLLQKKLHRISTDLDSCLLEKQPFAHNTIHTTASSATLRVKDDLKIIEGIGPVLEELLNSEGIYNFSQLGKTPPDQLVDILRKDGSKFQMHDPRSWPQQAALAQNGMWNELEELQKELNKGRFES
jgi:hypothetical protein